MAGLSCRVATGSKVRRPVRVQLRAKKGKDGRDGRESGVRKAGRGRRSGGAIGTVKVVDETNAIRRASSTAALEVGREWKAGGRC